MSERHQERVPMMLVTPETDTSLECDECWEPVDRAVLLAAAPNWAETGNARICVRCLREALAILEGKHE